MAKQLSCDRCKKSGTDSREFWHFPRGLDLCLHCAEIFNQARAKIDDEVRAFAKQKEDYLYAQFIKGHEPVEISESDESYKIHIPETQLVEIENHPIPQKDFSWSLETD